MGNDFNLESYSQPMARSKGYRAEVWLTMERCNLGVPVWEGLGSPSHIQLFYDRANLALKLVPLAPGNGGLQVIHPRGRKAVQLSVQDKVLLMPRGRYIPIGSNIFVHESRQR